MHEYLTTKQIVESVLNEAEKHGAKKVLEVRLEGGEGKKFPDWNSIIEYLSDKA